MGKFFGLILIGVVAWAGWQIHTQGIEGAFGGALAPSEAATDPDKVAAGARPERLSPLAQQGLIPGVD